MKIKFIGFHIEDGRTQNITRHQVGSKLYTAEISIYQARSKTGK